MATAPSTRHQAHLSLDAFAPSVASYAATRNFATSHPTTSRLSVAIRNRLILEEEVIQAVRRYASFEQSEKYLQEVVWRTYWKGWLETRPWVWQEYLQALRNFEEETSPALTRNVSRALSGDTQLDYFNAWFHELTETGYLHNHVRMWFASIWIFTLELPWQLGAKLFLERLLDGDPASNTLSWRWVAGLQTTGKHYLARSENIRKFTKGHWQPRSNDLREDAAALPDDGLARRAPTKLPDFCCTLPPPKSEDEKLGEVLLLHSEDLSLEVGALHNLNVEHLGVLAPQPTPHHSLTGLVQQYQEAALADATHRARAHWSLEGHTTLNNTATCVDWMRTLGAKRVITYRPFIGFVATALESARLALAKHDIELCFVDRHHDALFMPFATRGFFPFWESASRILKQQSLA